MTQPLVGQPNANPFGYDLQCTDDTTPDAAEVGGTLILAYALYRRASSPRGCLIYDPNYGYDLSENLNDDIATSADVARIGANLDAEFRKDARVYASQTVVTFTPNAGGPGLGALQTSTLVTPAAGPSFKLVLGVSAINGQVQILNVSPA